jgi:hypothetical protein
MIIPTDFEAAALNALVLGWSKSEPAIGDTFTCGTNFPDLAHLLGDGPFRIRLQTIDQLENIPVSSQP